jgi:hypothetical protein
LNTDGADGTHIINNRTVILQKVKIPGGLERLEPDQKIGLAFGHNGGKYLFPKTHLGQNTASPLRFLIFFSSTIASLLVNASSDQMVRHGPWNLFVVLLP